MTPTVFVLELVVKTTLISLAAGVGLLLLGRAPACYRHRLLALALLGAGLLPMLELLLPAWRLPLLPASAPASLHLPATVLEPPAPFFGRGVPAEPYVESSVRLRPERGSTAPSARSLPAARPREVSAATVPGLALRVPLHRIRFGWVLLLWLLGSTVVAFRALCCWSRLRWLERQSVPMPDGAATRMLAELAAHSGAGRPLRLRSLAIEQAVAPATWGLYHATILLPREALHWPQERVRAVLTHEFSHVRRADWAWQVLAGMICGIYWFHPAVWWMAARLRWEAELACDDAVLSSGVSAAEYARQLLEVVQMVKKQVDTGALVTTMARPAQLASRLEAILDHRRRRSVGRRGVTMLLAATVVTAVTVISSGRVSARSARRSPTKPAVSITGPAGSDVATDQAPRTHPAASTAIPPEPADTVPEPVSRLADAARADMPAFAADSLPAADAVTATPPTARATQVTSADARPPAADTVSPGAARATTPSDRNGATTDQLAALMDRRKALEQELKLIDERIAVVQAQYRAGVASQDILLQATLQRARVQATIAENEAALQRLPGRRVGDTGSDLLSPRAAEVAVAEARLRQAQAQLNVAMANLTRLKQLAAAHAVTVTDLERAQADAVASRATVQVAEAELARQKAMLQAGPRHGADDTVAGVIEGVQARLDRVSAEEKSLDVELQRLLQKPQAPDVSKTVDRLKRARDGIRKERRDLERLLQDLQREGGKRGQAPAPQIDSTEIAAIDAKIKAQDTVLESVRQLRKIAEARVAAGQSTQAEALEMAVQELDALQQLAALRARRAELQSGAPRRGGF